MNTGDDIRYLRRQEIDSLKWDRSIDDAPNGLIYGRSFYLDHMTAGQWDALVLNDYEAIMPLTWKKKWGIRYLYQPPYTQQLGIFAPAPSPPGCPVPPAPLPPGLIEKFLTQAGRHFRFAEIFLNYHNHHPSLPAYKNFVLDLGIPYNELVTRYKKGLVGSLHTAESASLQYVTDIDLSLALQINKDLYKDRTPHVRESSYRQFRDLCFFLLGRGQILLRAVKSNRQDMDSRQEDILAIVLFLREKGRIYLLQATTLPAGREIGANHFLLDRVIREFAGQPMTLDFEGSELPGIAHFYRSFGAQDQPYYFYRHNRLPWPLRFFK